MNWPLPDWIRRITPHRIGFWCGLLAPLAIITLGLKTLRIADRGLAAGLVSLPDLYVSELTGLVAFGLLGHTLLGLTDSRPFRHAILTLLQLATLLVATLEWVGHGYYTGTGAALDLPLFLRELEYLSTTWPIVLGELAGLEVYVVSFALATLAMVPWMGHGLREQFIGGEVPDPEEATTHARWTLPIAAIFALLSLAPPLVEPDSRFARSVTANLTISAALEAGERLATPPEVASPAADLAVERRSNADEHPDNIAIVVLESVRADATGIYNANRRTTPFLTGLAKRSTVAERAYATVPHTSKALVAILCGIEPRFSLRVTESRPDGIPARCLPDVLGDHGYRSAFFQTAHPYYERRPQLVANAGFDDFFSMHDIDRDKYHKINYFGWEEDAMLPPSRDWLETRRKDGKPFVATYLTLSGHHPYTTPPNFEGVDPPQNPPPAADDFAKYLDTVHYVDRFTRKLIAQYKRLGLYEDTLFVFVSDHGEAFGEHGVRYHDDVPYQEGLRIVTMLHDPSRPGADDISQNVSQIDLAPTILDRLGYDIIRGGLRGTAWADLPADRPVRSLCYHERRCLVRLIGDTKYIYRFGFRPPEVYDLADDPNERHNLAADSDRLPDWRRDLLDWRDHVDALYSTWDRR
ncbi:MAG: LTA synthase family protein [Bradymonadaceae bacterium]